MKRCSQTLYYLMFALLEQKKFVVSNQTSGVINLRWTDANNQKIAVANATVRCHKSHISVHTIRG